VEGWREEEERGREKEMGGGRGDGERGRMGRVGGGEEGG